MKTFTKPIKTLLLTTAVLVIGSNVFAVNKQTTGDGNWSNPSIWSPSGVPDASDKVTIRANDTVYVDGNYTCGDLDVGDAGSYNAALIVSGSNSLTITGVFRMNPNNRSVTTTLDAAAGTLNITGTFPTWSTTGTNKILVGTGAINFTPAVSITSSTAHLITFTGAGTITFNSDFSDTRNKLTTFTGCTVNFGGNYTATTTAANWSSKGKAVFTGTGSTVTANSNITFNDIEVASGKSLTFSSSGGGTITVGGSITFASGSAFTVNKNFQLNGSWTNNGTTLDAGGKNITLNGSSGTIGGTASTTFYDLTIGKSGSGATTVAYTLNSDASCNSLTFDGNTISRTLSLASGKSLTISGNLVINQPTTAFTNLLDVSAGTCTVGGDLTYSGTSITTSKVAKVNVTTGSFTVAGTVNWMSNLVTATEVLAVSTGTVTFGSPVSMLTGSGTIQTTGAATMNFNGTSGPSLTFGGAVAPVFTTASGTTVNFANGYTNLVTSPSFSSGTNINTLNVTIDPGTTLTNNGNTIVYGDLTSSSTSTFVNAANATLEVRGNISNNVTLTATASGNTVKYNGTSTQTIKPTSYVNLTVDNSTGVSTSSGTTTVSGTLNLTSGIITTTTSNVLKITSTGSVSGGSATSYINGPVTKAGNTDFVFPTGKNGKWMRVGISGIASAATEITAEYFSGAYTDVSNLDASLAEVSEAEYWDISRSVTSDPVKLKFYWENATNSEILSCNNLTIAHYTGGKWINEPATVTPGSSCSAGGSGSVEMTGTVSTFSPFGFGGGGGGGALPVKLVSFDAEPVENTVHTEWITELEINNSHFIVERGTDGVEFAALARIEGKGNSTVMHNYEFVDNNPLKGTSYYRLRQVDFDGTQSYSPVSAVTFNEPLQSAFHVYPNPTDNELFLNVSNPAGEVHVTIYDLTGRKMFEQIYPVTKDKKNETITVQAKYLLPTGAYLLSATTNGAEYRERMILK